MSHARNTCAMRTSRRCGAQTRNGDACRAPALRGRMRCRMHGGAWGSGAPDGNSNALKHGYFTSEAIEERQLVRTVLQEAEDLLRKLLARSDTICSPDEGEAGCSTEGTDSLLRD
ncbi:HGGxSTG domain-containing protein [Bradyrhizobium sp. CCBAU 45384]|uniref:HGGxSTG domain-containing protein n=1 Tax=Bradyrhizobium sp. CCBAU 45384 TaxID=858428 RepID=UPI002306A8D0|nr:HGGxSTG domain-containing protein [Bradyrhizobium sp. CCBAU 45384]